jgi:hypothetical protein
MDGELFRIAGGVAGLAGLAIGLILLLYREIVRKSIFPTLTKRDAYRLLRNMALLSWSVAMVGIFSWTWTASASRKSGTDLTTDAVKNSEPLVIAGTVVDQADNSGVGQATIAIEGETLGTTSDDSGNFRILLPASHPDHARLSIARNGYLTIDQSVIVPAHDFVVQLRRK